MTKNTAEKGVTPRDGDGRVASETSQNIRCKPIIFSTTF
jgi:hypothetical protein